MKSFVQRHQQKITGILSGLDRIRLRGTARWLAHVKGMLMFLRVVGVLLKDFKPYALKITAALREHAEQLAAAVGQRVVYLESSKTNKEEVALAIAKEKGITQGLVCILGCVEGCRTFKVGPNQKTKKLELRHVLAKCLHLYFYFIHPQFGWMHVRLQTWFPFTMQVCLNGREWLGRQMDAQGIGYVRRDNCFTSVQDVPAAQVLLDAQLQTSWEKVLGEVVQQVNPLLTTLHRSPTIQPYWSVDESEWATDVMFRSEKDLKELYPALLHHGMTTVSSADVMRFLGKPVPASGQVHGHFLGDVVTDVKKRPEGVRIRHQVNRNGLKLYDKQGSVLRAETTINDVHDMKAYRAKEGEPAGKKEWRRLRKGVSDLKRRTDISQASNERYLESLAAVEATTPLARLMEHLCKPVRYAGRRARALNPLSAGDIAWLEAVNRGEFIINGFRNKDLRGLLFGPAPADARAARSQSAKVTRMLRLLRAHGLIAKVPKTHRYHVSRKGREAIAALLAARQAGAKKLVELAA